MSDYDDSEWKEWLRKNRKPSVREQRLERYRIQGAAFAKLVKNKYEYARKMRNLTLLHRKAYNDKTVDSIKAPSGLFVLVGGRYHHILDRMDFPKYASEYTGKSYHVVTSIHWNLNYNTLNVQLSGFLNRWFYVPKRFYKHSSNDPRDEFNIHTFSRGNTVFLEFDKKKKNQLGFKITDYILADNYRKYDPYPPEDDPSPGSYIWRRDIDRVLSYSSLMPGARRTKVGLVYDPNDPNNK